MTPERMEEFRKENGYLAIRQLADGSIAVLMRLIFTTGIGLGVDEFGFHTRYCFEDRELAVRRFAELRTEDDEPEGYIAKRGK